ncbi:hypothetical protein DB42_EF00050 [Neochlamydia sp. EPS4]|nr:hypothetical protein DB42_EF00050 [Neochlamydia sp. EPS4]
MLLLYSLTIVYQAFYDKGLEIIPRLRKNMKNKLISLVDKILLRKRGIIESVNNKLNNSCQIEHPRTSQLLEFFCQSNQRNSGLCLRAL